MKVQHECLSCGDQTSRPIFCFWCWRMGIVAAVLTNGLSAFLFWAVHWIFAK